MRVLRTELFLLSLATFLPASVWAQTPAPAQESAAKKAHVLILGAFHMANPGRDIYNLQVDDVLAPKRQKEIAALVEALKKFHPTKIAVEAPAGNSQMPQQYQDYLTGRYALTRNEIDQIAFRLAKELGHGQVYPIDVQGDFPFDKVMEFAKKNGKEQWLNDTLAQVPKDLEKVSAILQKGTITDALRYVNQEEHVKKDQQLYMEFARMAGNGEYPGPDLLAEWYRRNARIFTNLRNIIDSPDDRVLVVYGSGHLFWLQRDVLDSRDLVLEHFSDYAH